MPGPKRKSTKEPARKTAHDVPKLRRRNRAVTEAALVEAASAIFAERGYEAATTKAIAERAGYSEALIQVYFRGKEGLLLAVINRDEACSHDEPAFFERPLCVDFEMEAQETLSFIAGLLNRQLAGLRIVVSRALVDRDFWLDESRPSVRGLLRAHLRSRLERYVALKRLPPGFDTARSAEMLLALGFTLGFLDREVFRTEAKERQRRLAVYATIFGQGIVTIPGKKEKASRGRTRKPRRLQK